MKNYKIVCSIEFPNGSVEYVIWEPEFYGEMLYKGIDVSELFYNISRNGFADAPVDVLVELYDNPQIKEIGVKIGDNEQVRQLLIGTKVLPIRNY